MVIQTHTDRCVATKLELLKNTVSDESFVWEAPWFNWFDNDAVKTFAILLLTTSWYSNISKQGAANIIP